ncbi:MAG: PqqD family protein [Lachnospiraceae bacterium]|nr:PqqD family protein [Lachnospiraceae bacterium]
MKFKNGIIITSVNNEKVLVDAGIEGESFRGIIRLNETGAFIAEKLFEETDEEALATALTEEYEVDIDTARRDVQAFIASLDDTHIII